MHLADALRHRARRGGARLLMAGSVLALATLTTAVLPANIASAAALPTISAPPDVVVGEASGSVSLPVTLSASSTSTVTVNYATSAGGNCNNLFQSKSGTLTFMPGVTSQSVTVTLNNCHLGAIQNFPDFTFTLSGAVNGTIVKPSTQIDVIGDGAAVATPGLDVRNAVVDNTAGNVMVPVLLGGPQGSPSNSTVTVNYTTANGSATAGTDYTHHERDAHLRSRTDGAEHRRSHPCPVGGRPLAELHGDALSPTNTVITQGTGTVTIGASGGTAVSSPTISAPVDTVVGEADGYIDLPVTFGAPGTSTVMVNYATSAGGNCNNLFQSQSGTLTFLPGVTLETVPDTS